MLQELLHLLAKIVARRRRISERELNAVLRADPIRSRHPAGFVEHFARGVEIVLLHREVRIVIIGLLRHEGLGECAYAVIDRVDDRLSVNCRIERLAYRRILELRLLKIEIDRLERCTRLQAHHAARQFAGFLIVVGVMYAWSDKVDVTTLELGVKHRYVRNVFEDDPLNIRPVPEIFRVRDEFDMVAGDALAHLNAPVPMGA